jgi:predicted site-specific integrase-resolvase
MKTKLTLTGWAKKVGVSRQRAQEWMLQGRIKFERPAIGVILIEENEPRPKPMTPYQKKHEEEEMYLR